jgi:hypothetical protein
MFSVTHIAANTDPTFRKKKNSENRCRILGKVPSQFLSSVHFSHSQNEKEAFSIHIKIGHKLFNVCQLISLVFYYGTWVPSFF